MYGGRMHHFSNIIEKSEFWVVENDIIRINLALMLTLHVCYGLILSVRYYVMKSGLLLTYLLLALHNQMLLF